MGKTNQNFTMFKGDAFVQDFLHVGPFWQTQREVLSVEASDTIEFRLHAESDTANVHIKKTRAAGDITVVTSGYHETNDTIRVSLDTADTNTMSVGTYGYQLEVSYGGTDPVIVASGTITLMERSTANP